MKDCLLNAVYAKSSINAVQHQLPSAMFPSKLRIKLWKNLKIGISLKTSANKALFPSYVFKTKNRYFEGNWHNLLFCRFYFLEPFIQSYDLLRQNHMIFWCALRNLFVKCLSSIVYAHVLLSNKQKIHLNWAHTFF